MSLAEGDTEQGHQLADILVHSIHLSVRGFPPSPPEHEPHPGAPPRSSPPAWAAAQSLGTGGCLVTIHGRRDHTSAVATRLPGEAGHHGIPRSQVPPSAKVRARLPASGAPDVSPRESAPIPSPVPPLCHLPTAGPSPSGGLGAPQGHQPPLGASRSSGQFLANKWCSKSICQLVGF